MKMRLTSVDWKLINDMYDVDLVSIHDVTVFDRCEHVFDKYIDGWMHVKENSTGGKRQIAKLMLNSLYGKFASRVIHDKKVPYLEDDRVKYEFVGDEKGSKPVYTPLGVFITAWARDKTIRAAAVNHDRFLYADTDSLHLLGTTPPDNLEISAHGRSRVRSIVVSSSGRSSTARRVVAFPIRISQGSPVCGHTRSHRMICCPSSVGMVSWCRR